MSKYRIINYPQGAAVTYYKSTCPNCHKDFPPTLPDIILTDVLYYHGFICEDCKKLIEKSSDEQEKFYMKFMMHNSY